MDISSTPAGWGRMGTGRAVQLYIWQHQCAPSSFFLHQVHNTPESIAKKKGSKTRLLTCRRGMLLSRKCSCQGWQDTFPEQRTRRLIPSSRSLWLFWSFMSRLKRVPCLSNPGWPARSSNSDRFDLQSLWRRRFFGDITIKGFLKSRCI